MEFNEVIKKRTATRKFKDVLVNDDIINQILEAGRLAPTAKNQQPQLIYVIKSKDGLAKIDSASPCRYNAPVVLLICSDKNIAWHKDDYSTYEMDASIVATHLMLEATNLGVDSVWVEMMDKNIIKQAFNLNSGVEPICLLPIGYATDDYMGNPMHNKRKDLSETVKYL